MCWLRCDVMPLCSRVHRALKLLCTMALLGTASGKVHAWQVLRPASLVATQADLNMRQEQHMDTIAQC